MTISSKRAQYVARVSLAVSVLFFIISLLIGLWSEFYAVFALSWVILGSVLVWFVLCLQFHQRTLAEQEKLDASRLAKGERDSTIFEGRDENAKLFAVSQGRLQLFEKWFIPIFSGIIGAYQIGAGVYLLKVFSRWSEVEPQQPLLVAVFIMVMAFVSFLLSRYATGMSAELRWKPLRAGGSFLLGIAVLCFALAVGLALVQFQMDSMIKVLNWVIPILLVVLGLETALNVVLDIYRPRFRGQYHRSAFDSRLLGLISEPGGIFRTAASAIDYQFGFKVSQTWFYKLLEKAIAPLVLFGAVTLYLLSCLVVVGPNEEAIIERFGNPLTATGQKRVIGPGLTVKWPWPIDIVSKNPTKNISELHIGYVPKKGPGDKRVLNEPLLWDRKHYEEEDYLLVGSEQVGGGSVTSGVPVSLLVAAVPVQYRIKDLYFFKYNHSEPAKLLEAICYRELTKFAASARIEVDAGEGDLGESLLGAGREEAKKMLTERIQAAADKEGLGVEIVFLGLQGIHPPVEVAPDYQKVVGAFQQKQAAILEAKAERNKTLSSLAGSVEEADRLYGLAASYQQAKDEGDNERVEQLSGELDGAFAQAKGEIFAALRGAQSYAFERATLARATGERFASQVKAYEAAKEIYVREQILAAFEEALPGVRKFVVAAEPNDTEVVIINAEEQLTPSLYDLPGFKKKESSGQ
jgi:membrane protease subunit HflK